MSIKEKVAIKVMHFLFDNIVRGIKKSYAKSKDQEIGNLFQRKETARHITMFDDDLQKVKVPVDLYTQDGDKYWLVNKENGIVEFVGHIDQWGLKQTLEVDLGTCSLLTNIIIAVTRNDDDYVQQVRSNAEQVYLLSRQVNLMTKIQKNERSIKKTA